jgi:hypothetical protein
MKFRQALQGILGLTQYQLKLGIAEEPTIANRVEVCGSCEFRKGTKYDISTEKSKLLTLGKCGECGCGLTKKVSLTKQICPKGRW